jgi:mono/diheme cytochrome c family protein
MKSSRFKSGIGLLIAIIITSNSTTSLGAVVDASKLPPASSRKTDFAKDIQPIFADRCYECHGPKKQEHSLRLDQKASALKGGDSGLAIVPGKSADSLLIHAVAGARDDLKRMPKKGDPLTAQEIGLLRAWIDQGAEWPDSTVAEKDFKQHWAFQAPVRPAVPSVQNSEGVRNSIDNFIRVRLEKEKLKPSPETDKITLLRRLSLDLIGLPPTIAEVDAFLGDSSKDAYEKQVERLLNSPHYGERWGRHWLDAARYADSDGYEKDKSRQVWFYRDWVINSLNRDLPYDRFVIDQLAGDLVPNPTQEQMVATGFLRNSMINEEGGVDPEQFRMDAMFDRMDAVGKSVLGLTIQCAQCHNHKYDPISQEEYYRIFAFLNNDHEAQRIVYTPDEQMRAANITRQIRDLEEGLRHSQIGWEERMAAWETSAKRSEPEWEVVQVDQTSEADTRFFPQKDGSLLGLGYAPTKFTFVFRGTNSLPAINGFRLELLTDANLPCNGPGRSFKGTCALTEFRVEAADAQKPTNKVSVKLVKATADFANEERELEPNFYDKTEKRRVTGPVSFAIDEKDDTAWGIDAGPGRRNQDRKAVFAASTNVAFPSGTILTFSIKNNHGGWNSDDHMNNMIGRIRLSVTSATNALADPLPKRVRELLAIPSEKRSPAQIAAVFSYWRTTVSEFKETNDKIEGLWKQWPNGSTALTLIAREDPRETQILRRGDWLKPIKPVTPGVPAFLHPLPTNEAPARLAFAKWLVDRRSPTTARVFVNRIWQAYFGVGLVSTPEDFGLQSEAPSHPELLDWLACEFMDRGWSLKNIHRLIVNSATYRQSSKVTPDTYAKDQYNRLLARGTRNRVEGEIVRDIALSASGLLNSRVGGPSVFSPAPEFLFQPPASYAPFPYKEETGVDRYRRALYTFRRRSTPYPMLQTFDAPNGDFSCVRRLRSNTPLQALMTLNETVSMECAQGLAWRTLDEGGKSDADRITYAFRRTLSRPPTAEETKELLDLLARQRQHIAEGWVNPLELATGKNEKPAKLPKGTTPTQLAAFTVVSRVLLNLDETITKE